METHKLDAQRVTKPIQLLAAWLIGLILIDGAFLAAATRINGWKQSALVLASIVNVPLFLGAMFLLQTKFRPELQEDAFYSKYLSSKTNQVVVKSRFDALDSDITALKKMVVEQVAAAAQVPARPAPTLLGTRYAIGLNQQLDNFEEIRRILRDRDISLSDIFGSRGLAGKLPGKYMAIDQSVDFRSKLEAIRLGFECRLDGYGYFNADEEDTEESILIGAYGLEQQHVPLSTELETLLQGKVEPVDLRQFESRHIKDDR